MHIRRTDFKVFCNDDEACLPVSLFAGAVEDLRREHGPKSAAWPVVVTTDDDTPEYAAEIAAAGWHKVDHAQLRTKERFGVWTPSLIDNVVLSYGRSFVGVYGSTSESGGTVASR